ncbi:MAG: selenium-dependent molybdenum cofactor biosynthesis protein YqeB [Anaerolineales bacterium]|jgi:xanthine dehydrogenase accessory factor
MIFVRGGGDLASGVVYRLYRAGIPVVVAELSQPLVVRRLVSFAETVYRGSFQVEGVAAQLVPDARAALEVLSNRIVPVLVDPHGDSRMELKPLAIVDGRMTKRPPDLEMDAAPLMIGLGPGFTAGENCHAVIETNRGHAMGRVIWDGPAESDTGIPEAVSRFRSERVLRAPAEGILVGKVEIGTRLSAGQPVAEVSGAVVAAPFDGVLRGLVHPGVAVRKGMKIGDLDPRGDPAYCTRISDKSLAVGGGVLEAILTRPDIRQKLWT